ncbi:acyl carrier protein [Streptomyces shenzhenensis]|uniref:Acyl carrier protein n=1 Tax=Streptomyces shenzhenensis TaxID=943815 RepID=A0A3M0IHV9_9ACTN|nr:acyl carrier protein [Streptomyces shenzhenensis]RMB81516.1 acyl carrier protein [Streptomyces shenzhenensis]
MSDTYDRLAQLLTAKFDVPAQAIGPEATLHDLGLDSLAVVELFVHVDQEWHIPVDEDEAEPEQTVHQVAAYVDACAVRQGPRTV